MGWYILPRIPLRVSKSDVDGRVGNSSGTEPWEVFLYKVVVGMRRKLSLTILLIHDPEVDPHIKSSPPCSSPPQQLIDRQNPTKSQHKITIYTCNKGSPEVRVGVWGVLRGLRNGGYNSYM